MNDQSRDRGRPARAARALGGVRGGDPGAARVRETWEEEWQDVAADIGGRGAVCLAEDDEGVAGALRATMLPGRRLAHRVRHVRPRARAAGRSQPLMAPALDEGRGRGSTRVTLDVLAANHAAVAAWRRLGFEPEKLYMAAPLDLVAERGRQAGTPAVARCGLRPDRRPRPGRAGGREVPAADRPVGAHRRRPAEQRLDAGRRRALQPRPERASAARARGVARARRDRVDARRGGERGRPLRPLGSRRRRRRVRLGARVLRRAPARRRASRSRPTRPSRSV